MMLRLSMARWRSKLLHLLKVLWTDEEPLLLQQETMINSANRFQRITTYATFCVALAIGLYALYVLALGIMVDYTQMHTVALQGVGILMGTLLVFTGLIQAKLPIAWAGVGTLSIFSVLFLFGSGALLLPFVGLLSILLVITTLAHRT